MINAVYWFRKFLKDPLKITSLTHSSILLRLQIRPDPLDGPASH